MPQPRHILPVLDGQYERWRRTNVRHQRQGGYATVIVTVPLGDLTAAQMRLCGDLALSYGDGAARGPILVYHEVTADGAVLKTSPGT